LAWREGRAWQAGCMAGMAVVVCLLASGRLGGGVGVLVRGRSGLGVVGVGVVGQVVCVVGSGAVRRRKAASAHHTCPQRTLRRVSRRVPPAAARLPLLRRSPRGRHQPLLLLG
jgi:hypothetical protein